nr:DUF6274 family protein [Streptomyces sp. SID3212]
MAAASGHRHLTRRCAICHRLQRLAMEPVSATVTDADPDTEE